MSDSYDNWDAANQARLAAMSDAQLAKEIRDVKDPSYTPGIFNLLSEAATRLERDLVPAGRCVIGTLSHGEGNDDWVQEYPEGTVFFVKKQDVPAELFYGIKPPQEIPVGPTPTN